MYARKTFISLFVSVLTLALNGCATPKEEVKYCLNKKGETDYVAYFNRFHEYTKSHLMIVDVKRYSSIKTETTDTLLILSNDIRTSHYSTVAESFDISMRNIYNNLGGKRDSDTGWCAKNNGTMPVFYAKLKKTGKEYDWININYELITFRGNLGEDNSDWLLSARNHGFRTSDELAAEKKEAG